MFDKIMVPIDLAHVSRMQKAVDMAADLAKVYKADVCYVGVTSAPPSAVAHTPEEYRSKLDELARKQSTAHGQRGSAHVVISHDPVATMDDDLVQAVDEVGADLVVMATHVPNAGDLVFASNGGNLARHTNVSVCLVRAA
ncbi:universal stress protein [Yoonia sp.]|uniref:universal stress protein n=1 Tax=Yoonia sp. TaxID=2212373 RepID=UPI002FDA1568